MVPQMILGVWVFHYNKESIEYTVVNNPWILFKQYLIPQYGD